MILRVRVALLFLFVPPDVLSDLIIAGDGYAYLAYAYRESTEITVGCEERYSEKKMHVRLLRLRPDGGGDDLSIADWRHVQTDVAHS